MARKATSYLDMAGLWDLHGFISSSESDELFSSLQDVRQDDHDGKLEALLTIIENPQADEILRVYAAKAYTVQAEANDNTVVRLKQILLDNRNGLYLRMAVSQALRYIDLKTAPQTLIDALIRIWEPELQTLIAFAIYNHATLSWQEKVNRLLQALSQDKLYREHLPLESILRAMLPPGEALQNNRFELTDYLINKTAVNSYDERMIGILAGLVIESVGRNLNRVNQRVNQYQLSKPEEGLRLESLLSELNSRLTPAELEARLKQTFHKPLNEVNDRIQAMWERAINGTQESLESRAKVGRNLLYGGIGFLVVTIVYYMINDDVAELLLGILVSLSVLSVAAIYSGRRKHVRQILADVGVANAVYAAYVQRTLEISNSFARRYLQDKLDPDELEKSNQLISNAMNDTVKALRDSGPTSIEDFIDRLASS